MKYMMLDSANKITAFYDNNVHPKIPQSAIMIGENEEESENIHKLLMEDGAQKTITDLKTYAYRDNVFSKEETDISKPIFDALLQFDPEALVALAEESNMRV